MPDISMCYAITCPRRGECYRYLAKPNHGAQYYDEYDPDTCGGFWSAEMRRDLRTVEKADAANRRADALGELARNDADIL